MLLHEASSSQIAFGLTLFSGKRSLSAQPVRLLSSPFLLGPQESTSTFISLSDGPAQTDTCELTQIKENKNLVLNHVSESINWTLSWMCGKYNCCFFPTLLDCEYKDPSFRMGRNVYKELAFFFLPDSTSPYPLPRIIIYIRKHFLWFRDIFRGMRVALGKI